MSLSEYFLWSTIRFSPIKSLRGSLKTGGQNSFRVTRSGTRYPSHFNSVGHEMVRKQVGVTPAAEYEAYQGLFLALSSLLPVEFRKSEPNSYAGLDALIVFGGTREAGIRAAKAGIRCHVILNGATDPVHSQSADVDFGKAAALHAYFQGQTLVDEDVKEFIPIPPLPGDDIVASRGEHVLWT